MKIIKFIFAFLLTISFFLYFNFKHGTVPPLGSFLSPFTGFWQNGEKEVLNIPEILQVDQLKEDVIIKFDEQLFPHIFAKNDYDLYFAQGYVTAFHRLWQMEFQVLAAAGRISEVVGEAQVQFDIGQRRKGLVYGAQRSLDILNEDPEILNMLQAYTDGVNYWVSQLNPKQYPLEYKLLDYAPEPWTNLKSMLLLKNMADMLSRGENDLENTNALALFGRSDFEKLFPTYDPKIDPVIPKGTKWDFETKTIDTPDSISFPLDLTKNIIEKPDPRNGSNNFAVARSKTINGKVMLANEPDLGLNLPSIWYVIQLNAPGVNTFGASLPGAPNVFIGFNDSIAWGLTNAKRDVVDWYAIKFRNERREEYQYNEKWLKTEKVVEKFAVRDADPVYDTIVYTHYGPVVYDHNFLGNGEKKGLAMRWTAHDASRDYKTLYQVNRAKNYDEFLSAFEYYTGPPQNFAFASGAGDIAITVQGKFPLKWNQQGKFLMDGSDPRQEWQTDIPAAHNATVLNPERGFISSANQFPVDDSYPYYVYDYRYEHYRNRRINDRLTTLNAIKVEDMIQLQNDNFNYSASESLPFMLQYLDTLSLGAEERTAYDILVKWDYFTEPEWLAPSIYQAWWDLYYRKVWDEFENQEVALGRPNVYNTIRLMNEDSANKFFDVQMTMEKESAIDLLDDTFKEAIVKLNEWKMENGKDYAWYQYKNTRVNHILQLAPFSVDHIKIGGYNSIVNAASGRHGPSWRMVVELDESGAKGWGVYPGSQTGNPGNPMYAHMIENWATGNYYSLLFLKNAEEENENLIFTQKIEAKQ